MEHTQRVGFEKSNRPKLRQVEQTPQRPHWQKLSAKLAEFVSQEGHLCSHTFRKARRPIRPSHLAPMTGLSQGEKARQFFLRQLKLIPQVRYEIQEDRSGAEPLIRVFLPSRGGAAWRRVRELEGETVDRFPGSGLSVRLSDEQL